MAELSAGDLRCRVELLRRVERETEFGTTDFVQEPYDPPRKIWAKITPSSGTRENLSGDMERPAVTHRIQCRRSALPEIPSDLVFRYRGQDYELQYGYPNYQQSGFLDLYVRLVVENIVRGF